MGNNKLVHYKGDFYFRNARHKNKKHLVSITILFFYIYLSSDLNQNNT